MRFKVSWDLLAAVVCSIFVFWAHYLIFMYVPNEKVMGAVQRVFYFHVGSAMAAYVSFAVVFLGSLMYLAQRSLIMDCIAEAAAEVGFLFCTIVLVSGMLWGYTAWGTWFNWEPRLVTFLLLWLCFMAYVCLRYFGGSAYTNQETLPKHAAVLGIVASCMVPVMVFSIKLLPQIKQLHPQVIEKQGLDPKMGFALVISIVTCILLQAFLLYIRIRIGLLERRLSNG